MIFTETCSKPHDGKTHNGKDFGLVSDKLTTMCGEGKQHCHTIATDAKVTCAGKPRKAADLPRAQAILRSHQDGVGEIVHSADAS